jgi:hypothetical protein
MLSLQLYGTHTHGYEFIKKSIHDYLSFHGIENNIIEIDNIAQFIKDEISSVPSVRIGNEQPFEINESGNLHFAIKQIYRQFVKQLEIKSMRNILCFFDYSVESIQIVNWLKHYYSNSYYTLYLFDINEYHLYKFKNDHTLLDSISKNFEQSFVGDLWCNLVIKGLPIEYINNEVNIDYEDYERIIIPYTKNTIPYFYNKSEAKILETHQMISCDTFKDKAIKFVRSKDVSKEINTKISN